MQLARMHCLGWGLLTLFPLAAWAQVEKLTADQLGAYQRQLPQAIAGAKSAELKAHLSGLERAETDEARRAIANAVRVAGDLAGQPGLTGPIVHYAVPAMSETQRLPDAYPLDGRVNAPVRIIAAQDEYEPGSFVLYPLRTLGKVKLVLGEFKSAAGAVFPHELLDLKVVKVWYQNRNAWYSYFGDTGLKLVPELLLNDEDLIRVDPKEEANYARLSDDKGQSTYRWISPPKELDSRYDEHYRAYHTFSPMKKGFADAKTLQPVALNSGQFKQFFLTAHVTAQIPPGIYNGSVRLLQDESQIGAVPVTIRVLPISLPAPKAYFDQGRDFISASYSYISFDLIMDENGGDRELAEKQFLEIMKNQRRHNQFSHWVRGDCSADVKRQIELLKEAGMTTDPLLGGGTAAAGNKYQLRHGARMRRKWFDENLGHHNVLLGYGDEPGASWLVAARPVFEAYQKEGLKFVIAGNNAVFYKAGYVYDFHNIARDPEDRQATRLWNEVGHAWVAWYATQHVGPENPAFNRRQYGMAPYLANYSAVCNYAHHLGPYNDNSTTYRPMVFAYGTYDGVIDTLQWEGFREAIDDIRYATCLVKLARQAAGSREVPVAYEGRKALQFFAELDAASADLQAARLEMINKILKLQDLLHQASGSKRG